MATDYDAINILTSVNRFGDQVVLLEMDIDHDHDLNDILERSTRALENLTFIVRTSITDSLRKGQDERALKQLQEVINVLGIIDRAMSKIAPVPITQ